MVCAMFVTCLPQAIGDVISSIGIGTAAADSIGYQVPARYWSNPRHVQNKIDETKVWFKWLSHHIASMWTRPNLHSQGLHGPTATNTMYYYSII